MKCTSGSYQFSLNTAGSATFTLAKQGTDCSEDYVGIEGIYLIILKYLVIRFRVRVAGAKGALPKEHQTKGHCSHPNFKIVKIEVNF